MIQLPNLPADRQIASADGRLTDPFWLFLDSAVKTLRATDAAFGWGTAAERIAAKTGGLIDGSFWIETDTGLVYQWHSTAWAYVSGTCRRTQAQLATLAGALGTNDAGLLVEVTDYRHVLRWTGTGWSWGPGEDGRHDIVALPVDPDDAIGWQLCDGSTVAYLKGDGTTGNFTTPDLTSAANKAAYLKLGDAVSGPDAAVAPTFTGALDTTSSVSAGTPAGAVAVGNNTGTGVAAGAGSLASPQGHSHAATFTGNALAGHTHTVTPTGIISDDGEPRNYELRPWFRR